MASFPAGDHPGQPANRAEIGAGRVCAGQTRAAGARLELLADLIATSPHNLVSARDRAEVFDRHVVECDALADYLHVEGRWLDLGTGGGLPGLVLALAHPASHWTLLDATRKKADAVTGFVAALGITNVEVVAGRAEALAHASEHRGAYDGVVARAVAPLRVLAELARGFLGAGGQLVAMKGPAWREELAAAEAALATLRFSDVHTARLAVPARESWVVTMRADGPPPAHYPRRDGIPRQQPL